MDRRLATLLSRLAILGASPERREAFEKFWDLSTDEERNGLRVLGDLELRARANALGHVDDEWISEKAENVRGRPLDGGDGDLVAPALSIDADGEATGEIAGDGSGEALPDLEQDLTLEDLADTIIDGTIDEVLAWVGDQPDRARAALDAELACEDPRRTLVPQLEKLSQQSPDPND